MQHRKARTGEEVLCLADAQIPSSQCAFKSAPALLRIGRAETVVFRTASDRRPRLTLRVDDELAASAAVLFLVLTGATVLFQIALMAGAPWGSLTWGGKFPGVLPARMRGAALLSALLLSSFAIIIAHRAGLLTGAPVPRSELLSWVVVGYCGIGVLANAATPSKWERRIWLPVVIGMLCSSLIVAMA